jgi:hypothetical protein
MDMEDGRIQFRTCTDCEATRWERGGVRLEIDALTAIPGGSGRDLSGRRKGR